MQKEYERWLNFAAMDETLRHQLQQMKNNETAIVDAFYEKLSFGTGGIRGILGPGPNRMNIYTVRKTVQGLASYLKTYTVNYKSRGVVVAYDSRHYSREFAFEVAKVLGNHGIKTYIFDSIQPTPLLSFAVRHLRTVAGIMITASHNPPNYNGLKVYNEEGSQITSDEAEEMIRLINEVEDELAIPIKDEAYLHANGLLQLLYDEIESAYISQVVKMFKLEQETTEAKGLRIVFTPLHGTATKLVTEGLKQLNFSEVHLVEEQAIPDPDFSTVRSPNPEDREAFDKAIGLGEKVDADILLATDPDADRLGVAVKMPNGQYETLTGNELGALLLDYILTNTDNKILPNARFIKTIVTTELGRKIASSYGVETIDTLTGFKYIGEKINEFDTTGETFIFGFEESYGYLKSTFVRDKDGVQTALLTCAMAEMWRKKGLTLFDALRELHERHGYYKEAVDSLTLEGMAGVEKIVSIVDSFRQQSFKSFGTLKALWKEDYLKGTRIHLVDNSSETLQLPKENVVKYILEDHCWVCLRPSGTEPKIKWYYGAHGKTEDEVIKRLTMLKEILHEMIVEENKLKTI